MVTIELICSGAGAIAHAAEPITENMVGLQVHAFFGEAWQGLTPRLYARCNGQTKAMPLDGDNCATIPWEILKAPKKLELGADGWSSDGSQRIATVWAPAAFVNFASAAPCTPAPPPSPTEMEQILTIVGNALIKAASAENKAEEAKQEAGRAGAASVKAENAQKKAETAAAASAESEKEAERFAALSQQGAAEHGYMYLDDGEDGHLYLVTSQDNGIIFEDNNGRLEVIYE